MGPSASHSYFKKTVTLYDWWLIKPETHDDDTKAIGVAGTTSTSEQNRTAATRCFTSAPISKVFDIFELYTVDDVCIILQGFINKDRTLQNGFSPEVFNHFVFGFPVYWEEFATSCPKKGSTATCVSEASVQEDGKDSVEGHAVFHDCDDHVVDSEIKECQDTCFVDKTSTFHKALSPEIPPDHIDNIGDEVLCEKTHVRLEFEDDPRLLTNPMSIDVDGVEHNVVKNVVDSSKPLVVSSRRMTRSMKKMDIGKSKSLRSHDIFSLDKVTCVDPINLASTDILRKDKNGDLSNNKAVDSGVMPKSMKNIPKIFGGCGKESNETASSSQDIRNQLTSKVGQEKNKEDTDDVSGNLQIVKGRSYLGVKCFKSLCSESSTPSVGCQQVNASSTVEDFNFTSTVPDVNDDSLKANIKACQNKMKNKKEEIPETHRIDFKKTIMTRSRSKGKVTPQCEMGKRKRLLETPTSMSRAKKDAIVLASKDPHGSANIVSPEDFSGKKSRSGRVLLPAMEFWRNQKVVYDKDHQVYGIQEPI